MKTFVLPSWPHPTSVESAMSPCTVQTLPEIMQTLSRASKDPQFGFWLGAINCLFWLCLKWNSNHTPI